MYICIHTRTLWNSFSKQSILDCVCVCVCDVGDTRGRQGKAFLFWYSGAFPNLLFGPFSTFLIQDNFERHQTLQGLYLPEPIPWG